ncbi:MAG: YceD family protein [Zoogloeaceae bacterium]|nr:YceD family protein [Zoogloeaceae bacterium]
MSDAYRFARESGCLEGVLELSALPRLADVLASLAGTVSYRLSGFTGEREQARLRLQVTGTLQLRCQRCLGAVEEVLAIDSRLELASADSAPTQEELEDERLDILPVTGALDISALVEDEILLALPTSPRHVTCSLPATDGTDAEPHPFAALAVLKHC